MLGLDLLAALVALFVAVCIGTTVHELLHAAVLRAAGVPYELQLFGRVVRGVGGRAPGPARGRDVARSTATDLDGGLAGSWASVRILAAPEGLSTRTVRVASLAPLSLALPFVLVAAGVVPDPFAGGDVVVQAAALGVLACALPSPADFSLVWYPETATAVDADGE